MFPAVLTSCYQFEVFNAVVMFVPVFMMNAFISAELQAEMLFHHIPVFKHSIPVDIHHLI